MFYNRFADRKSQPRTLLESIDFIETVEYFFLAFLGNTFPVSSTNRQTESSFSGLTIKPK